MNRIAISAELAAAFPIDARLKKAIDRWQDAIPVHLLRAALMEEKQALSSFKAYQFELNPDDQVQRQLLGQMHCNIGSLIDASLAEELKAMRLATLIKNKILFREMGPIAECLDRASIPVLALKGAGVAPTYYTDIGCRPMSDLDLLVPEADIKRALVLLVDEGWEFVHEKTVFKPYFDTRFSHAIALRHQSTFVYLDLHCHINHRACWPGNDAPYWSRAVPLNRDSKIMRLSDADNLMHACIHGIAQNHCPPVRWAMDAYQIIETCGDMIEWGLLIENAKRVRSSAELLATLVWLHSELDTKIPFEVFNGLKENGCSMHALQSWSFHLDGAERLGERAILHWNLFGLRAEGLSLWGKLKLLPAYIKHWQNRDSYFVCVLVAGKKLLRIIWGGKTALKIQ